MNKTSLFGAIGAAMFYLATSTASAAPVTQFGTDVSFTYDDGSMFGTGTVVGNNIFFTPTGFLAESLDGEGTVTDLDTLNIDMMATTEGYEMDMFNLVENGDYRLNGAPSADVDVSAFLQVTSLTTPICGIGLCQDQDIFTAGALADTGGALALWNLGGSIDLADTTDWGSDTKVRVTLQNDLLAYTENFGDVAFIQKKFGTVGVVVNPVPVPAAVWLFGSGLLGLIGIARRNKAA